MPRRLQTKTAKRPQPINVTKWAFWFALSWLALAAAVVWCVSYIFANREATLIGHSVACEQRPAAEYFQACNAMWDGPACSFESRSLMMEFYEPIDYACSKLEPQRPFRFPVYQDVEYVEG